MTKLFFRIIKVIILAVIVIIGINVYVMKASEDDIAATYTGAAEAVDTHEEVDTQAAVVSSISEEEMERLRSIEPECILVLGASVKADGTPSPMLRDRLEAAIALYHSGVAPKLLLSGDNGQIVYNEVETMKRYAVNAGVPEEDIFLDHAGFSTYESIYRAQYVFQVKRMIVVTQKYHLYRALYGCKQMGISALGVSAAQDTYSGQELREVREILARDKDCVKWIFRLEPTFLGEAIPISGSGTSSH